MADRLIDILEGWMCARTVVVADTHAQLERPPVDEQVFAHSPKPVRRDQL